MFSALSRLLFGTKNDRFIKAQKSILARIDALEPEMQALELADMPKHLENFKKKHLEEGLSLDELLPEVFALVREASVRVLGMRHYDVQMIGGIALHKGNIAEMKTGEGKTLVATLPVVLNALSEKGVHVVTVNDYLAKRDAAWMGALYAALGLTTGVIVHGLNDEERQKAYAADITYGTNNEFGFDYLRDNMKFYAHQLVQRPHNFAIVDEVDSILIDEARTPLIISGATNDSTDTYKVMDALAQRLRQDVDFTVDEKARSVILTDEGTAMSEKLLGLKNLFDPANITAQHHILQSLRARYLFKRDVDYIVQDGQVVIVDEFTGRLMPGRRFSDGLHQALEAKEQVKVASENQTLASITFQNYFRLYEKLSGMTGTADTEAVEFAQIYGLEVISIPPNKVMQRKDFPDSVYRTRKEKFEAIVEAIADLHKQGQPALVGTISIETSEFLSKCLKKAGIPHNVLNAKHHEQEAEIIAQAGQKGKVTIATNMAGRGTDIVLGEGITDLGGLHILGTERHESRRIDNQLRGRAGRQGDPGSSRFYLSLEDDLMRLFGSERLSNIMLKLGMEEGEPIENKMVSRAIENAQKRVEGHHFEIRKTLLEYDNVMSQQRTVIYELRREIMFDEDLEPLVFEYVEDVLIDIYDAFENVDKDSDTEELENTAKSRLRDVMNMEAFFEQEESPLPSEEEAREYVEKTLHELKDNAKHMYKDLVRYFLLEELDRLWKEHLRNMDALRDGIGLRGYGHRDPKLEYKKEGFAMFQDMLNNLKEGVLRVLTRLKVEQAEEAEAGRAESVQNEAEHEVQTHNVAPQALQHRDIPQAQGTISPIKRAAPARHELRRVGRNETCPCGSGKKYKKCCAPGN